jgi:hypothetical protein
MMPFFIWLAITLGGPVVVLRLIKHIHEMSGRSWSPSSDDLTNGTVAILFVSGVIGFFAVLAMFGEVQ